MIKSVSKLKEKLQAFCEGNENIENCWIEQVKLNKNETSLFSSDEDANEILIKWIKKLKLKKIAGAWIKGLTVDWDLLYRKNKPNRISLPTYPFSRELYPVENQISNVQDTDTRLRINNHLHPLLQQNTSDFTEQRFSSIFTGDEFFLKDHQVKGDKVLPGVAHLEMAGEAVKQALGNFCRESQHLQLKNIVWAAPITVNEHPQQVHIGLFPEENGEIGFDIYTNQANNDETSIVHCQGMATIASSRNPSTMDISKIQEKLNQKSVGFKQRYEAFKAMGIEYGPAYRGVDTICAGESEMLAKLILPVSVGNTADQFTLHPSLLDAALQASIGLGGGKDVLNQPSGFGQPSLPFALESLELIEHSAESMWAWIRYSNHIPNAKIQKLDIDICDDAGRVCVKMKGMGI